MLQAPAWLAGKVPGAPSGLPWKGSPHPTSGCIPGVKLQPQSSVVDCAYKHKYTINSRRREGGSRDKDIIRISPLAMKK